MVALLHSTCVGKVDGLTEGAFDTQELASDANETMSAGIVMCIAEQYALVC